MAPVRVAVSTTEPGFTPVAFLAVVEYVDPDGAIRVTVVNSDGITDGRRDRLIAELAETGRDT